MSSNDADLTRRVAAYIRHRPRYLPAALDVLKTECDLEPAHLIADIGCGPGVLSQLFLDNGNPVTGIEPDDDMRAGADHALRGYAAFNSLKGSAESTTLPGASVDFVVAGQAFHWFDPGKTRPEFVRILRPGGWVALFWNIQRKSDMPFQAAFNQFWQDDRFWNRDRALTFGSEAWQKGQGAEEVLEPFFSPGGYGEQWFDNPFHCDLERLKGRVFSTLPGLYPGESRYDDMLAALEEIFEAHQQDGEVTIEHDMWLVYGQLSV